MKSNLRVFSYLKRYPGLATAQFFCATLMAVSVIFFPKITQIVIDDIVPNPARHDDLLFWIFLATASYFLKDGLNCARIFVNNHFEQNVVFDIRSDLYQKIQRLPLNWFDSRRTGDIMTRVVEDVTSMERVLIDGIELGLVAFIQLIAVGLVMYLTDWQVALWATLPIPILLIGAWIYSKDARHRHKAERNASSSLNSLLHDNIAGIRQIKSYAAEDEEHTNFNRLSHEIRKATLHLMKWWAIYNPSMSFASMLGYVLVLGFGASALIEGRMSGGDLVFFFLLLGLFYEPVGKLRQLNQMIFSSRAAADRVFEIMDSENEPNASDGESLPPEITAHVRFDNVSFAYGSQPTLNKLNLDAPPGHTIALVGSTGAGKSTVLSLLNRFYEHDSGTISIDGTDISALSKSSLREKLAYVTQEAFLFNGSVRENLTLAKRDATDDEMWLALEAANGASFVRNLPDKLDTNVGERGVKLSGGEKQRLSIARALLKNAPILLLDEATASVDSETESQIQAALDRLMENRTAFVIAHRLSTIQNADRIYVMEKGGVIEEGTHNELLAREGKYAELCRRSFLAEREP
ncbi:MAG: ABC transporter ATP-binding protein/permease [Akkermansiaceae bacterium]|jgi:ATP-binding cassette, subfamily B, bacterial|nr:ABC transporter ATP-binding protein/permease [Akkermansiaceae bacterium]MDP4647646.1 ABC transporter ATP-binding protein/permease [Akkermansiaceae bacterium]MDP4722295.1 ABC transporter ATP-binding protein/permease [Akkermansiaceae bacterium]MDP4780335.1 ABC transporter ATP-binding protein/permease [Akkermansiaceae bacterium]MDP4846181.1 ABC transporter ATP-binding protein/permease [Akkermansiaceae bacterium]